MTRNSSLHRRRLLKGMLASAIVPPRAPLWAGARRYDLHPAEIADGIWMILGATESFHARNGGAIVNVVLLETKAGAIVVDTGSTLAMGAEIRSFAESRLGGVALVVNTHHHPDHWFGNGAFADRRIFALPASIAASARNASSYAASLYPILGTWMAGTTPRPADTPVDGERIAAGGRHLRVLALSGHTEADLALLDERTGTLIAGDLLFLDRAPSFPDADVVAWRASLDLLERLGPSGSVPGHGPFHRSTAALLQTRRYIDATDARLRQAAHTGLTQIEVMAAGPVPEFRMLGANPEEYLRTVAMRWTDHDLGSLPIVGGP